jgi:hypothetical protein
MQGALTSASQLAEGEAIWRARAEKAEAEVKRLREDVEDARIDLQVRNEYD